MDGYEKVLLNGRALRVYAGSEGEAFVLACRALAHLHGRSAGLHTRVRSAGGGGWFVFRPSRWEVACG